MNLGATGSLTNTGTAPVVRSVIRLYEIQAKLRRADKHLSELKTEIAFARNFHSDGSVIKDYPDGRHQVADLFDDVFPDIRAIIGGFANALRSSLNYFVAQLAKVDSGSPANRSVQFPIEDCPKLFKKHRTTYLKGISDEHVTLIERLQPYNGCDWMKTLQLLSNIDKHRGLVAAVPVASSVANNASTPLVSEPRKVKMDIQITVDITFSDRTRVIETLEVIQLRVTDALDQFDALMK